MSVMVPLQKPRVAQLAWIGLSILLSLAAGATSLFWASPYSPLIVGGAIAAIVLTIALFQRPLWALYTAICLSWLFDAPVFEPIGSFLFDLSLLVALLSWVLDLSVNRRPIIWEWPAALMVIYVTWGAITLFWAADLVAGRREFVQYMIAFVLLFLTVNQIDSLPALDGMMRALALTGWLLVLAGVGTALFTGYQLGTRLKVFGINENLLGTLLIPGLVGVLWLTTRSSGPKKVVMTLLSMIFILLNIIVVLLTGSRGSSTALLVILLAFWVLKPTRLWAILGLFVGAVALLSAPSVLISITNRLADPTEDAYGGRLVIWQASLWLISDKPLTGAGVGNGPYALHSYMKLLTDAFADRASIPGHDPILEIGADTGIVGIILYLSVLASAIWQFMRRYYQLFRAGVSSLDPYFALVICAFVGYMSSWVKSGDIHMHATYIIFLTLLIIPSRLKDTVGQLARADGPDRHNP